MIAAVALAVVAAMIAVDLFLHIDEVWTGRPRVLFRNRNTYTAWWIGYWTVALAIATLGLGSLL